MRSLRINDVAPKLKVDGWDGNVGGKELVSWEETTERRGGEEMETKKNQVWSWKWKKYTRRYFRDDSHVAGFLPPSRLQMFRDTRDSLLNKNFTEKEKK